MTGIVTCFMTSTVSNILLLEAFKREHDAARLQPTQFELQSGLNGCRTHLQWLETVSWLIRRATCTNFCVDRKCLPDSPLLLPFGFA